MIATFYAEDLGITRIDAEKVALFMELATKSEFTRNPTPWANHGKVRVYFEPWSQNSLTAYHLADKWFYDANEDDVFAEGFFYGSKHIKRLHELSRLKSSSFSGAKTKARLVDFSEAFYGKKIP